MWRLAGCKGKQCLGGRLGEKCCEHLPWERWESSCTGSIGCFSFEVFWSEASTPVL